MKNGKKKTIGIISAVLSVALLALAFQPIVANEAITENKDPISSGITQLQGEEIAIVLAGLSGQSLISDIISDLIEGTKNVTGGAFSDLIVYIAVENDVSEVSSSEWCPLPDEAVDSAEVVKAAESVGAVVVGLALAQPPPDDVSDYVLDDALEKEPEEELEKEPEKVKETEEFKVTELTEATSTEASKFMENIESLGEAELIKVTRTHESSKQKQETQTINIDGDVKLDDALIDIGKLFDVSTKVEDTGEVSYDMSTKDVQSLGGAIEIDAELEVEGVIEKITVFKETETLQWEGTFESEAVAESAESAESAEEYEISEAEEYKYSDIEKAAEEIVAYQPIEESGMEYNLGIAPPGPLDWIIELIDQITDIIGNIIFTVIAMVIAIIPAAVMDIFFDMVIGLPSDIIVLILSILGDSFVTMIGGSVDAIDAITDVSSDIIGGSVDALQELRGWTVGAIWLGIIGALVGFIAGFAGTLVAFSQLPWVATLLAHVLAVMLEWINTFDAIVTAGDLGTDVLATIFWDIVETLATLDFAIDATDATLSGIDALVEGSAALLIDAPAAVLASVLEVINGMDIALTGIDLTTDVLATISYDIVESAMFAVVLILYMIGLVTYPIQTSVALVVGVILGAILGFIGWIIGHVWHP